METEKTIDVNISFYENPGDRSTNIQFHAKDNELSIEEFVDYMKRACLAYGFSTSEVARITVAEN